MIDWLMDCFWLIYDRDFKLMIDRLSDLIVQLSDWHLDKIDKYFNWWVDLFMDELIDWFID